MAVFTQQNAEDFTPQFDEGIKFFQLKANGQSARVRFLYNTMADIVGHAVHELKLRGSKSGKEYTKYVDCLNHDGKSPHECPFCQAGFKIQAKLFLLVLNEDTHQVELWTRGPSYYSMLSAYAARCTPLVSHVFEVTRCGEPNDPKTQYPMVGPLAFDGFNNPYPQLTLEQIQMELPIPQIMGDYVLVLSAQEMTNYLNTGVLPQRQPVQPQTQQQPQGIPVIPGGNYGQVQQPTYTQQPVQQNYAQQAPVQYQQPQYGAVSGSLPSGEPNVTYQAYAQPVQPTVQPQVQQQQQAVQQPQVVQQAPQQFAQPQAVQQGAPQPPAVPQRRSVPPNPARQF